MNDTVSNLSFGIQNKFPKLGRINKHERMNLIRIKQMKDFLLLWSDWKRRYKTYQGKWQPSTQGYHKEALSFHTI